MLYKGCIKLPFKSSRRYMDNLERYWASLLYFVNTIGQLGTTYLKPLHGSNVLRDYKIKQMSLTLNSKLTRHESYWPPENL